MKTITSQNEVNCSLEKKYFNLRLEQEKELSEIKSKHNLIKKESVDELKKCKNVSVLRINQAISMLKKMSYLDIDSKVNMTYDTVLNNMERSFKRHYENNESSIKKYIQTMYLLQTKLSDFRKTKKKVFDSFKNKLRQNKIDPSILNQSYIEFKNVISYIKSENITLDEYNKRVSKYEYLNDLSNSFIIDEYNKIKSIRDEKIEHQRNKEKQEEMYAKAINDMFGLAEADNHKKEEDFITSILLDMVAKGEI